MGENLGGLGDMRKIPPIIITMIGDNWIFWAAVGFVLTRNLDSFSIGIIHFDSGRCMDHGIRSSGSVPASGVGKHRQVCRQEPSLGRDPGKLHPTQSCVIIFGITSRRCCSSVELKNTGTSSGTFPMRRPLLQDYGSMLRRKGSFLGDFLEIQYDQLPMISSQNDQVITTRFWVVKQYR